MSIVEEECYYCKSKVNLKCCSKCKSTMYCCKEHQKKDWSRHKISDCILLRQFRESESEMRSIYTQEDYHKFYYLIQNFPNSISHFEAVYRLAYCYLFGIGTSRNFEIAYRLFQEAADNNYINSYVTLASCFYSGRGVMKNLEKALYYYRLAAINSCSCCQFILGLNYSKENRVCDLQIPEIDLVESHKWLLMAAIQGDSDAQYVVGKNYMDGKGTIKNEIEGMKYIQLAANQGDKKAKDYIYAQNGIITTHEYRESTNDYIKTVEFSIEVEEENKKFMKMVYEECGLLEKNN